jgi:hypothetical protein
MMHRFRSSLLGRARLDLVCLEDRTVPSITLPTPGAPGPVTVAGTDGPDRFVVRMQAGSMTNVQFSDNGGGSFQTAALADVTSIAVQGLRGHDLLTVDLSNGLIGNTSPGGLSLTFDGGPGRDALIVQGNAGTGLTETYAPGATSDAGTLTLAGTTTLGISFSKISQVIDTATATQITVNQTAGDNVIRVATQQGNRDLLDAQGGRVNQALLRIGGVDLQGFDDVLDNIVSDDLTDESSVATPLSFVPISLANKAAVTVNAGDGNDLFLLDARQAAGVMTLTLDGGPGTDKLISVNAPAGVGLTTPNVEQTLANDAPDAFIQRLYLDRLHRPAGDADLTFWKGMLPTLGRTGVAAAIDESGEALLRRAESWYEAFLGRAANPGDAPFVANLLQQGGTEEQVLADFLTSAEFQNRVDSLFSGSGNDAFVRGLYEFLLDRTPSSGEVSAVSNFLATVSRDQLIFSFLRSPEHLGLDLNGLYDVLLNRAPEPGALATLQAALLDEANFRHQFMGSLEYFDGGLAAGTPVTFDANGQATVSGAIRSHDEPQTYSLTAPRDGTVTLSLTQGASAVRVTVEDAVGTQLFATGAGITSGSFTVMAGQTYFLVVHSTIDPAVMFSISLTLS